MKQPRLVLSFAAVLLVAAACDTKKDPVTSGREAVREVATQPFGALEGAKESLKQSKDKAQAALEAIEQESKQ